MKNIYIMVRKQFHIAELISRHLLGSLSPEEELELKDWRASSDRHEKLFRDICHTENIAKYCETSSAFNKEDAWKQLSRKFHRAKRRQRIFLISRYAAILLLPLFIGAFIWFLNVSGRKQEIARVDDLKEVVILPGEKKAMLTLESGETIDLNALPEKKLQEKDGTAIVINENALNYQSAQAGNVQDAEKEIHNKIEVPLGGEYALTLSDGTKVHLNAMSSLKFPVRFVNNCRVVELEGEGYFEVAKSDRPFLVKVGQMEVEVLGTTFNLSAYDGESRHATLVEGALKVSTSSGSCLLKPSEQAYIEPDSDNLDVRKVDVMQYTSWVNGKIIFRDARLEEIMNSLSRWYDMDVLYKNPALKDFRFGCNVNRSESIAPFLELLKKTGKVDVDVNGKAVIFSFSK